ncbi:hypothetical protein JMJ35_005182 [Cladonia borealis]|uniref:O-methyltransferase n=1 Tax=Cladonia borealis TaxID=184061 RepID=A0AA39V529_9LECA|nr:hypothetical protein JMJ35_005182 [Cladonia borealis]
MLADNKAVCALIQSINAVLDDLNNPEIPISDTRRQTLIKDAEKLTIAAREPEENLYFQATQTAQNAAIRTALSMGVFEKLFFRPSGMSATELSESLGIDRQLLVRIMRECTSTHLFDETWPEHYKHNAFSSISLVSSNRDMFQQMYDFAELNGEYLKQDPERTKVFDSGMRSLATISDSSKSAGVYPFNVTDTDVSVVDVGGGRGQGLESIKAAFPQLKGRMILQDVQEVIDDARAGGLAGNIEPQLASFFDGQHVKGAFNYYFRRIFHDWSDAVSQTILRNTVQAMDHRSRILITDTDINMMSFTGMERTQSQWKELLEGVGLQVRKFWTYEGNLQNVIEARLKE